MKPLHQYILEHNEDAIYFRLAKHIWNFTLNNGQKGEGNKVVWADMDKFNIHPHNDPQTNRRGLIRWYKANFIPLPKNEDLIIKYKDWHMDELVGQTELQGLHPDWDILDQYIYKHPKKRHDILILFECSNKKPYNSCRFHFPYMRLYDKWCDYGRATGGVCPDAYADQYPYRVEEWDHAKEGEYMGWVYRELSKVAFKEFMDSWKYKYVIVVMQGEGPRQFLTQIKEQNLWGLGDKMELVIDDEYTKKIQQKYSRRFKGGNGLITTRMLQFPETKLAVNKAVRLAVQRLGGSKEDLKELEEIEKVMEKGVRNHSKNLTDDVHKAGFGTKPSYSEYPYGEKDESYVAPEQRKDEDKKNESMGLSRNMIVEMSQQDFTSKLHKLEKELDELDPDKVKGEAILNNMGDDVDLYHRPDDLFKKYEWAWPCMKLLYWMNGRKFDVGFQKDYRALKTFMANRKNWGVIDTYFFWYKPLAEKMGWKEEDIRNKALRIHFIEDQELNKEEKLKILQKHGIYKQ